LLKKLIFVGGTMGVGKTTTCRFLQKKLPGSVFLDGDWCWDAHPFQVTEETRVMVVDNICHLINNFLRCSAYEYVIFCWVMHEQQIIDDILSRLSGAEYQLLNLSLTCTPEALYRRLEQDIAAGIRTPDVISRSTARLPMYERVKSIKLDVSAITPAQAAEQICELICAE